MSIALARLPKALPEVLEQEGPLLVGDLAVGGVGERGQAVMAAEDHREVGHDRPVSARGVVERRAAAEDGAGREVLDLALAVDRGVGDHRDRLLEVVGQVLALGREGGQRAVVAERADRLGAVVGHLLDQLDVVALPAEAGEDAVLDLDRLLGPGVGVAGDLGALERAAGDERAVVGRDLLDPGPLQPALTDLGAASPRAGERVGACSRSITTRNFSPGASGFGSETISCDRDDAGLGAEDEVLRGLELSTAGAGPGRRRRTRTRRRGARSAPPGPARTGPIVWRRYR